MESNKKVFLIKIALAIVYLSIVIGVECVYREALYNKSLKIEQTIQENISKAGRDYFAFITHLGELKVTLGFVALVFIFFSLSKSFALVSIYIYGYYFTNLMKMMYHSPRPFWDNNQIQPSCNTGFGNPSGHSVTTFSLYLGLFHIITDFDFFKTKKHGIALRIVIFSLFFLLMLFIVTSRVVLGAHGINQVLYGSLLGLAIYFIIYHIMAYPSMTNMEFYSHLFNKTAIIVYFVIYSFFFFFNLFYYLFGKIDVSHYVDILKQMCPSKKEYQLLYHDGFIQSISITGLIGAHLALLLLYYLAGNKYTVSKAIYINEWNFGGTVKMFFIRLPINILSIAFLFLNFIKSDYLWILFIFKSAFSFGLGLFGAYGIGIYICLILEKCNPQIYNSNSAATNLSKIFNVKDEKQIEA